MSKLKDSFVVGVNESGQTVFVHHTNDAGEAKRVFRDVLSGKNQEARHARVFNVRAYLNLEPDKGRDVPAEFRRAPQIIAPTDATKIEPVLPPAASVIPLGYAPVMDSAPAVSPPEIAPQFVEALKDDDGPQEPDEIPAHAEVKPKPRGKGNKARD